jgi:hypothetical protein
MDIKTNNLVVPINELTPNDFNPKPVYDSTEELKIEFERIKDSIKNHGQVDPIIVREPPEKPEVKYEIVNGFHRWVAMKELGFEKVEIKNLGKISKNEAIKIALSLEETKIPLDVIEVAKLVKNLKEIGEWQGLPYSLDEINTKISLLEFNFDKFGEVVIPEDIDIVSLVFKVTKEQKEVIVQAIDKIVKKEKVTEGRALELICASFLAEPYPNP